MCLVVGKDGNIILVMYMYSTYRIARNIDGN